MAQPTRTQETIFDLGGLFAGMFLFALLTGATSIYCGWTGWQTETGEPSTYSVIGGVIVVVLALAGLTYIFLTTRKVARALKV